MDALTAFQDSEKEPVSVFFVLFPEALSIRLTNYTIAKNVLFFWIVCEPKWLLLSQIFTNISTNDHFLFKGARNTDVKGKRIKVLNLEQTVAIFALDSFTEMFAVRLNLFSLRSPGLIIQIQRCDFYRNMKKFTHTYCKKRCFKKLCDPFLFIIIVAIGYWRRFFSWYPQDQKSFQLFNWRGIKIISWIFFFRKIDHCKMPQMYRNWTSAFNSLHKRKLKKFDSDGFSGSREGTHGQADRQNVCHAKAHENQK